MKDVSVEGDAQLIGMRGKRKHVCDFTAVIKFIVITNNTHNTDKNDKNSDNGDDNLLTMTVTDITADRDFEFEVTYPKISTSFSNMHKNELISQVKLLKNNVTDSIVNFLNDFILK